MVMPCIYKDGPRTKTKISRRVGYLNLDGDINLEGDLNLQDNL